MAHNSQLRYRKKASERKQQKSGTASRNPSEAHEARIIITSRVNENFPFQEPFSIALALFTAKRRLQLRP